MCLPSLTDVKSMNMLEQSCCSLLMLQYLCRRLATLHPCWLQLRSADGHCFYLHLLDPCVLSAHFYTAPIGGTCGGLLCDSMGLGWEAFTCLVNHPCPSHAPIPVICHMLKPGASRVAQVMGVIGQGSAHL